MAAVAQVAGCSFSPGRMKPQSMDPSSAASRAMETLDSNSDGQIDKDEVKQSPGLAAAFKQFDSDASGSISQEEIANRLDSWAKSKIAFFATSCSVTMDKRPLEGAKVKFVPEPFLGESFSPLEGVSSRNGYVQMEKKEGMPGPGLLTGLYRVEVSRMANGKEEIPSRYNTETVLGQEVAANAPALANRILFELTSD